jgi:hypothetical protein
MGLGVAVGSRVGAGAAPAANPNLLLWTEEMDEAVWIKTSCSILVDQEGVADEVLSSAAAASVAQVSATAATTGSDVTQVALIDGGFGRFSVTGTFDGLSYTYAVDLKDTGLAATPELTLRLGRSGGFLRVAIEDAAGDADYLARNHQLEQAATPSAYVRRSGT